MMDTKKMIPHIENKISYQEELLKVALAEERYLDCAVHRDEIKRLRNLI